MSYAFVKFSSFNAWFMALTIVEEFLLLALDDKKGNFVLDTLSLNYGLAGAILFELALQDNIRIDNRRLYTEADASGQKNQVLRTVVQFMEKEKKARRVKFWVQHLGRKSYVLRKRFLQELIDKGLLRHERKRFLFIPYHRYPAVNDKPENDLRTRLRKIILEDVDADVRSVMLISLLRSCKLTRTLFASRKEYRQATRRIKQLTRDFEVTAAVSMVLREIQTAVMASVASASVVTTGASS